MRFYLVSQIGVHGVAINTSNRSTNHTSGDYGSGVAPLRGFIQDRNLLNEKHEESNYINVGSNERIISTTVGTLLTVLGLKRRDIPGMLVAAVGGSLIYRGATGHCSAYQALNVDTSSDEHSSDVKVRVSYLINKPAAELYAFWRKFENLPQFMSHLESVTTNEDGTTHWVAKAPSLYGGKVEWDAEIFEDRPYEYIAWRSLENSDVHNHGSVRFRSALGDRGTNVRVELAYAPPFGQVGRWIAKLFGEEPEQQVHDDLRKFKRLMETGEVISLEGQPRGTCAS